MASVLRFRPLGSRAIALLSIGALHLLVILGFITTLALRPLRHDDTVLTLVDIAPEARAVLDPQPIEAVSSAQLSTTELPPVDPAVDLITLTPELQPPPLGAESTVTARVPADTTLAYTAVRSPDEYYPPVSAQLGEQGAVVVYACADARGRLQGQPRVQGSSGFERLDAAAVKWASEALRFTPATRAGTPVAACKGFRVTFRLKNAQAR